MTGGFHIQFKIHHSNDGNHSNDDDQYSVFINDFSKSVVLFHHHFTFGLNSGNYLRMSQHVDKKLGEPFNDCIHNSDQEAYKPNSMIKRTVAFDGFYKQDKCYYLCYLNYIGLKYNCSFPQLFEIPDLESSCHNRSIDFAYEDRRYADEKNCSHQCPLSCNAKFISILTNQVTYHDHKIDEQKIAFYVYFEELKILETKQIQKTTPSDLISKIGGTLGLFIGFRLLSLVDVLEFFLEFIIILSRKMRVFIY